MTRWLALLLLGVALSTHAATASLRDDVQLVALLSATPQCCVIDARGAAARKEAALPGALAYRDGLRVKPTSVVIVLADTDARAMAVATTLARSSPFPVYAVKGGYATWRSAEFHLQAQASKPGTKFTFVIPHNTCQQDAPLHVFEAQPARPAASAPK